MPSLRSEETIGKHVDLIEKFIQLKKFSNMFSKMPNSLIKGHIPNVKKIHRHLHKK